jgi:hypothetical protein
MNYSTTPTWEDVGDPPEPQAVTAGVTEKIAHMPGVGRANVTNGNGAKAHLYANLVGTSEAVVNNSPTGPIVTGRRVCPPERMSAFTARMYVSATRRPKGLRRKCENSFALK